MKDYQVNNCNLDSFIVEFKQELKEHKLLIVSTQPMNVGKWGMARLWRSWMKTTADFMASNGVTMPLMFDVNGKSYGKRKFNADDAHELFTRQHLGTDQDGNRLSWAKSGNQRKATKVERFHAMQKHEAWASERGIILLKPLYSEYVVMENKQNG